MELDQKKRYRIGKRAVTLGLFVNIFLVLFKITGALAGGSTAVLADAIHSGTDVLGTGLVYISLWVSHRPADASHPYGHGRAETIATKVMAIFLISAGLGIGWNASQRLTGDVLQPGLIAWLTALLSVLIKEGLFRYTLKAGRQIRSSALEAVAWEHRSDVLSSLGVLVGVSGGIWGYAIIDPLVGLVVSLLIVRVGYLLGRRAIDRLMDARPEAELMEEIRHVTLNCPGVEGLSGVRVRHYGPFLLIDMEIEVKSDLTVREGHAITDDVERTMMETRDDVADILIHVHPVSSDEKDGISDEAEQEV